MKRVVEPELLDELPPQDPRAIHSRGDLRRINFFMGNARLLSGQLRKSFPQTPPKKIVELGGGDGTILLQLAKKFPRHWKPPEFILVDQQKLVSQKTQEEFQQLGSRLEIVCADVFDWLKNCEPCDCLLANLFLHHFDSGKLTELLRLASEKTKVFLACEPRRSSGGIFGTKLLGVIGCNDVTRHDAAVSVRAGFCGNELSALWPQPEKWKLEEVKTGLFSHAFVAARL